jgi:hypothetical protein
MFPSRHRPRIIARQQAAPYEEAQQAQAHLRRYRRDGVGIERASGTQYDGQLP